jgi:hypothetical protein
VNFAVLKKRSGGGISAKRIEHDDTACLFNPHHSKRKLAMFSGPWNKKKTTSRQQQFLQPPRIGEVGT